MKEYLVGPSASLFAADLSGAYLTNANVHGTQLRQANLAGATPTGIKSGGIVVGEAGTPPTLPANWQVIDGHLIGPYAQLHEAVLTNADLTGVHLSFGNQAGATSTGVTGAAKYNTATMLPAGFDPVAAGWTLVS